MEKQGDLLAAYTEELATLRFTIILTAKWERSASEEMERRDDLRADLVSLRRDYSEKIDEIAMIFGVQQAMKAKERVERTVTLTPGIDHSSATRKDADRCI